MDLDATDAVSIDRVVAQQRRSLERLVAGVLDRSEAEDVVQEALIRLDTDPVRHRPYPEVASWLRRVCLNLAFNRRRDLARWRQRAVRGGASGLASQPNQPDEEWLIAEDREAVRAILDTLSERHRAVLLLRYSGYSYAEVAASLEMPLSSVGATLARAESAFRTQYEEHRHELS